MRTSSSSALALLALLLGACNALLGLDGSEADADRDSVADAVDNCPLDPNPQQRDRDGNGLGDVCDCTASGRDADGDGVDDACDDCIGEPTGADTGGDGIDDGCEACAAATGTDLDGDGIDDACDACPRGADHDEDRDGIADACDNCPAEPNPDQAPAADGALGAACADGHLRAATFDGFAEQDPTVWPGTVLGWQWRDDGVELGEVTRSMQVAVTLPLDVEARGTTDGMVSVECRSGTSAARCTLRAERTLQLGIVQLSQAADHAEADLPAGTGPVRFRLRAGPTTSACDALDAAGTVVASAQLAMGPQRCEVIKVVSLGASRLEYIWVATE